MNNNKESFINQQLDSSFQFDSKAQYKPSKNTEKNSLRRPDLDLSQRTSQIVRFAQCNNQKILQLLEESQQQKKTQRPNTKNDLWQFFARFQQQSNPDITISDIQFSQNKTVKPKPKKQNIQYSCSNNQTNILNYCDQPQQIYDHKINQNQRKIQIKHKKLQNDQLSNNNLFKNDESRYPKRNRVHSLRYWLGQKCEYRQGKIVNIVRLSAQKK